MSMQKQTGQFRALLRLLTSFSAHCHALLIVFSESTINTIVCITIKNLIYQQQSYQNPLSKNNDSHRRQILKIQDTDFDFVQLMEPGVVYLELFFQSNFSIQGVPKKRNPHKLIMYSLC